jgi:hypothetical protein
VLHCLRVVTSIVALSAVVACQGNSAGSSHAANTDAASGDSVTSGGGGGDGQTSDGWPAFGPNQAFQLRRLTTQQYVKTVETLLGVSTAGMPPIEPVTPVAGFTAIGASSVSVSGQGVAAFEGAASYLAGLATAPKGPRERLTGCTPKSSADMACFESFVTSFGQRAFRRPLGAAEVSAFAKLAAQVATDTGDVWQGIAATLSAFLQAPSFLYLTEVGEPVAGEARYRYTDHEMAARLGYFLTNDTPDDELLAAAAAGKLVTSDGVRAQAERLLALPAAHDAVQAFFSSLLGLEALDTLTRPVALFPKFTSTLGAAMRQETALVLDDLVFERDGDYRELFDRPKTFVNAELAALYGLSPPAGTGFIEVTLPPSAGRVGLLGHAGVLAARDHADGTSPTKRGLFLLTRLLCQNLPLAPPANLQIPPPPSGRLTARERLTQHASSPVCASCHQAMDPVGLSLEHFDAMGVYRETDQGLPIDDRGELDGQPYEGEPGLGAALRHHPALAPCLIRSLYGVAVGHLATDFDQATFRTLVDDFQNDGARIRQLLAAIVLSEGFRYLPAPSGG